MSQMGTVLFDSLRANRLHAMSQKEPSPSDSKKNRPLLTPSDLYNTRRVVFLSHLSQFRLCRPASFLRLRAARIERTSAL